MQQTVATWSLILGGICFALYVVATLVAIYATLKADVPKTTNDAKGLVAGMSPGDASKLLDSLKGVIDSLAKAGPATSSLIAALLFFAIAAACSGVIQIGTPPSGAGGNTSGAVDKGTAH